MNRAEQDEKIMLKFASYFVNQNLILNDEREFEITSNICRKRISQDCVEIQSQAYLHQTKKGYGSDYVHISPSS